MQRAIRLVERRQEGRQFACESIKVMLPSRCIKLHWKHVATYNSVHCWVASALAEAKIPCTLLAVGPRATQVKEPARKAGEASQVKEPARKKQKVDRKRTKQQPSGAGTTASANEAATKEDVRAVLTIEVVADKPTPAAVPNTITPMRRRDWLVLKAIQLEQDHSKGEAPVFEYDEQGEVGHGTFGVVTRAVVKQTGERVCLKKQRVKNTLEFLKELEVLCRLDHPNVVTVLDVLMRPRPCFVLADAGESLRSVLEKHEGPLAERLEVMAQLFAALRYLHSMLLVHADIKPANMCWQDGRLQVVDMGSSVVSTVDFDVAPTRSQIASTGLDYVTLWYRSPEILFGFNGWSFPVDIWSAGVVWAECLLGSPLFAGSQSQVDMMMGVLRLVGAPRGDDAAFYEKLPLWSSKWPACKGNLIEKVPPSLEPKHHHLFLETLRLSPAKRFSAQTLCQQFAAISCQSSDHKKEAIKAAGPMDHGSGTTEDVGQGCTVVQAGTGSGEGVCSLPLITFEGQQLFRGGRGEFNLREGFLGKDVLGWLRSDPFFDKVPGEHGWQWNTKGGKGLRPETGVKLELTGHLRGPKVASGLQLNGADASQPLFLRLRAFAQAFKAVNGRLLLEAQKAWRQALKRLEASERGVNGDLLLTEDVLDWACDVGAIQLMSATDRCDPFHWDGGASFIHIGLTLYGARRLCLELVTEDALEDGGSIKQLRVTTSPGHIYCGSLCSAKHYVEHWSRHPQDELLNWGDLGPIEVVALVRCRVFRAAMGSTAKVGPVPRATFWACLKAFNRAFAQGDWRLPTLAECQVAEKRAATG